MSAIDKNILAFEW